LATPTGWPMATITDFLERLIAAGKSANQAFED
jgi:hypothetical protein